VIPVVTPEEMAAVDRAAPEPVDVLVGRAGAATAACALDLLGGAYGRRVVVVAGPGNNGADGRAAARLLARRGALVVVVEPSSDQLPPADLVVDAAFGTGLGRAYAPPDAGDTPVLAVDIPSGLSGLTGHIVEGGGALAAAATVTFAALKPGLLLGDGPSLTGPVHLHGIGLAHRAGEAASAWLVEDVDVRLSLPPRPASGHKWQTAVGVIAGSPGMAGAPWLVARAAMRAGAGYVRLGIPGMDPGHAGLPPGEAVGLALPEGDWVGEAAEALGRCRSVVVGPGLAATGRMGEGGEPVDPGPATAVGRLLRATDLAAVVDADGLNALGSFDAVASVLSDRNGPVVLTPHEGEWARLTGSPPGADRLGQVRDAARRAGAVVLLKGSVTVVAAPDGRALLAGAGSPRLATAGTGDALSGMIGAFLARGVPAFEAAALGAHTHGRAAALGAAEGLIASDLPDLVSRWLSSFPPPGGLDAAVRVTRR